MPVRRPGGGIVVVAQTGGRVAVALRPGVCHTVDASVVTKRPMIRVARPAKRAILRKAWHTATRPTSFSTETRTSGYIWSYRYMRGWKSREHLDFDFHDAHELGSE